jgi:hypothetical protein
MTEGTPATALELEDVLRRLDDSRQRLMDSLAACNAEHFNAEAVDGESIKRTLERTVDDLNFYYGRLVARAMSLPQPPCLQTADFMSLREAVMSLQVAHRRFSNLLHDLIPADLDREAVDAEHGSYTMRQLLEMSAAHYDVRTQQVNRIAVETPRSR